MNKKEFISFWIQKLDAETIEDFLTEYETSDHPEKSLLIGYR